MSDKKTNQTKSIYKAYTEEIRTYKEYRKQMPAAEKAWISAAMLAALIFVLFICSVFFNNRLNDNIRSYGNDLRLTVNTVKDRFIHSDRVMMEQYKYLYDLIIMENSLEREYLEQTPGTDWPQALNLLTSEYDNVEFYYYEGEKPVLSSNNAKTPDISEEDLRRLFTIGFVSVTNKDKTDDLDFYAASDLGSKGKLVTVYRTVGFFNPTELRPVFSSTQTVDGGGVMLYMVDTGEILSATDETFADRNFYDLDFSKAEDISDGNIREYSIIELLSGKNPVQIINESIGDAAYNDQDMNILAYYDLGVCMRETAEELILPMVILFIVCMGVVFTAGTVRTVRSRIRSENEIIRISRNRCIDKILVRRLASMLIISLMFMLVLSNYVIALNCLSHISMYADVNLESINKDEVANSQETKELKAYRNEVSRQLFNKATKVIEANGYFKTDAGLAELASVLNAEEICLFDASGVSIASSEGLTGYTLSHESSRTDAADNPVENPLWGVLSSDVTYVMNEIDPDTGRSYAALKCRSEEVGMVRFEFYNNYFGDALKLIDEDSILIESDFGDADIMYYEKISPEVIYVAESGTHAYYETENTLSESVLHDGNLGISTIGGRRYFINVRSNANIPGDFFISAYRLDKVFEEVHAVQIFTIQVLSVIIILMFLTFIISDVNEDRIYHPEDEHSPENADAQDAAANIEDNEDLIKHKNQRKLLGSAEELLNRYFTFSMKALSASCLLVFFLYIVLSMFGSQGTGSLVRYLFTSNWEKGPNIFSVTMILILCMFLWIGSAVVTRAIELISDNMGPSGMTIGRLLVSVVRFVGFLGTILIVLSELGVETATILTSAGLTSVVVGIGAQSTVSNILAGVFIIFEGNFRVGDIISMNGWTGKIREIGVRTTSIESYGYAADYKNIRVINNSDFNNVINLSMKVSQAVAPIPIPYEADLKKIEDIFNVTAPQIAARLPEIIDGPFYDGVIELQDSAKLIRFRVMCNEADRTYLEIHLLQQCTDMLESNGISIPFNQLVIHNAEE